MKVSALISVAIIEPLTAHHGLVTGPIAQVKVVGFVFGKRTVGIAVEIADQNVRGGVALRVCFLEIFRLHHAVGANQVFAGVGNAVELMRFSDARIEDSECPDHLGVGIGEKRHGQTAALREIPQKLRTIEANRRDVDAFSFKGLALPIQLNQLAFAVRSPIRRTVKQQQQAVRPLERFKGLALAVLVDGLEGRNLLPNGRAGRELRIRIRRFPGGFGLSGGACYQAGAHGERKDRF